MNAVTPNDRCARGGDIGHLSVTGSRPAGKWLALTRKIKTWMLIDKS